MTATPTLDGVADGDGRLSPTDGGGRHRPIRRGAVLFARFRLALLALVSVVALAIAADTVVEINRQRGELEDAAARQTENLADTLDVHAAAVFRMADLAVSTLADALSAHDGARRPDTDAALRLVRERLGPTMPFRNVVVTDADGFVRADGTGIAGTFNVADRDYFQVHRDRADRGAYISQPTRSRLGRGWFLAVSRRIEGPGGAFAGVAYAVIDLDTLERFYAGLDVGPKGFVALLGPGGLPLVRHPRPAQTDTPAPPTADALIPPSIVDRVAGTVRGRSPADGEVRTVALRPVGDLPVTVAVGLAESDYMGDWSNHAQQRLVTNTAALLLVLLLVALLLRHLRRLELTAEALHRSEARLRASTDRLARARDQAEDANRTKSAFLATMSHELRTPLNAIIGFSEIMADELFGPLGSDRYRSYSRNIHTSAHHLLDLINDVLDMSKLEADRYTLDEHPVDLHGLLDGCAALTGPPAQAGGVELVQRVPAELPWIVADGRALRQIVLNLLSNAVKFTPRNGRVTLSAVHRASGEVAVVVADTGIGIPGEAMERITEPFHQADSSISRQYGGTGLGLAISRCLVERHGGVLSIASMPGQGTTVTVALPAHRVLDRTGEPVATPRP